MKEVFKFGKEQWHEKGYTTTDPKKEATYSLEEKWIGYKLAVYDMPLQIQSILLIILATIIVVIQGYQEQIRIILPELN